MNSLDQFCIGSLAHLFEPVECCSLVVNDGVCGVGEGVEAVDELLGA